MSTTSFLITCYSIFGIFLLILGFAITRNNRDLRIVAILLILIAIFLRELSFVGFTRGIISAESTRDFFDGVNAIAHYCFFSSPFVFITYIVIFAIAIRGIKNKGTITNTNRT